MDIIIKNLLLVKRSRNPADFKIEEYESDSELKINMDENTLFKETVGYSVIKSYISALTEP